MNPPRPRSHMTKNGANVVSRARMGARKQALMNGATAGHAPAMRTATIQKRSPQPAACPKVTYPRAMATPSARRFRTNAMRPTTAQRPRSFPVKYDHRRALQGQKGIIQRCKVPAPAAERQGGGERGQEPN